jgi:hypothetical protein
VKIFLFCIVFTLLLLLSGCGVTQPVRTLEEGSTQITSSFGGPIIPFDGFVIPTPYLNLGALYGYSDNISLYGNVHLTALLFKDIGIDGGAAAMLVKETGLMPEITVNGRVYFFWDVIRSNNKRFFPMITFIASYTTGEYSLCYFGADHLYQIHKPDIFLSPLVGYQFPLSGTLLSQIEIKWLAVNKDTHHGIFEGATSIGGAGGMGLFFGVNYTIQ